MPTARKQTHCIPVFEIKKSYAKEKINDRC